MTAADVIHSTRQRLGRVGIYLDTRLGGPLPPAEVQRQMLARIEELGYGSAWTNEAIGGKDVFAQLGIWLAATERFVVGSGIANMWARPGRTMHGAAAVLADGYPGRFVLGIGTGKADQAAAVGLRYDRPLAQLRSYLDQMEAPPLTIAPPPDAQYPRLLAAVGPKMLALAGERADGALPAAVPPEQIAAARETLGPDKLLIQMLATVPDTDRQRAREIARTIVRAIIKRAESQYVHSLGRLGFTEEEVTGLDDRVLDALAVYGDETVIAKRVNAYLDAGADHVVISAPAPDLVAVTDHYARLAPAVLAS
ncbi:TIGR03620 family F420-dependent LLM class oxidoreductase [Streptomyces sp. NL15-2K]|uniref:TIGR03620 family F420-dependent LLM class oxidoreductase n=1 Tax=Streptomyces sp. NL15-2K TaxID=376149 RepID=UPI000FF98A9B|nr:MULTISPECIES: TIGR03620 family F420-dependent LLM class oxidoreductase [Actinomycetes]WKX10412.1 TIGR03620 family F420-dependent LLM class oxidoreductase [Kutzneria buriramensis]GCB48081.1 coenzyme F420-dependent N5,N10-methylene tetrahydromethanopterin reductase and related flavin-dependent oxidoreductases [Streptomyces sp. NL15-2K]